ncbi:MAG: hypothetical protein V7K86_05625 [Nostoc sp.]|uniref:hypothetical protein n=1 Tax=Nostoc sp. TaxID=1180 RepID=UPI002FF5B4FB
MYSGGNDWVRSIDVTRTATLDANGKITTTIGSIEPDVTFTQNTIGVLVESASANPNWFKAGTLFQGFPVPFGSAGFAEGEEFRVILRRYMIYRFTKYPDIGQTKYLISFTPQWYIKDVRLQIWQYIGTNQGATLDSLAALSQQEIAQTAKLQASVNKVQTSINKLIKLNNG